MYIFIGNLPSQEYKSEINHLLQKYSNSTESQRKLNIQKHGSNFFCVANIGNDRKARKFIKKYNLKSPYGHQLMIREFFHRTYGNERRSIGWRKKHWQGTENRFKERRSHKTVF